MPIGITPDAKKIKHRDSSRKQSLTRIGGPRVTLHKPAKILNSGEAIQATREALDRRNDKSVPTEFIIKLLELLTKWNNFEFNGKFYQQLGGTAMGQTHAPDYADIFMATIDQLILETATQVGRVPDQADEEIP